MKEEYIIKTLSTFSRVKNKITTYSDYERKLIIFRKLLSNLKIDKHNIDALIAANRGYTAKSIIHNLDSIKLCLNGWDILVIYPIKLSIITPRQFDIITERLRMLIQYLRNQPNVSLYLKSGAVSPAVSKFARDCSFEYDYVINREVKVSSPKFNIEGNEVILTMTWTKGDEPIRLSSITIKVNNEIVVHLQTN